MKLQRPIYVIAHRCNTLDKIRSALKSGANALECDVTHQVFGHTIPDWFVNHDPITEGHTDLTAWLNEAKRVLGNESKFALIIFDIKGSPTKEQVKRLRDRARRILPNDLYKLFSFGSYDSRTKFYLIDKNLNSTEGVAIDAHNEPDDVEKHFAEKRRISRFWYGNGISAALPMTKKGSLGDSCRKRDKDAKIKKVYTWTLEKKASISEMIVEDKYGVDGVMVNLNEAKTNKLVGDPVKNALQVIQENGGYRKATRKDNAFEAVRNTNYTVKFVTSDVSGAGTDSNIYLTITGSRGSLSPVRINSLLSGNAFERGDTDYAKFSGLDVGTIKSIRLRSDGKYAGASWHLAYVKITKQESGEKSYFGFKRWIKAASYSKTGSSTFPYENYKFVIKTTNKSGAGTDSNIDITLTGSRGSLKFRANKEISGNAFERSDRESFTLKYEKKLGTLKSITVKSDGKYAGSDWHLSYINVNGKKAKFNKWIKKGSYKSSLR